MKPQFEGNKKYAQRYYLTALDYFDREHYDKALLHIDKAIAKDPRNADYLSTKGVFFHKLNDVNQAIESYKKAIAADPNHAFAHFNLGLIYMKAGKTTEAIREWQTVIKVNPNDENAIFNIAVSLEKVGRKQESILFYEKLASMNPGHAGTHQNLGILYRDERNFEKARHHLGELQKLDSTYSEAVFAEIQKCNETEFLEKTCDLKAKPIITDPRVAQEASPLPELSEVLTAIIDGNFPEGLRMAEAILERNPSDLQAKNLRGQCLAGCGRTLDAIMEFKNIIEEDDSIPDVYFQLGNLFLGINDIEKAAEHFEIVHQLDPSFPILDENVKNLLSRRRDLETGGSFVKPLIYALCIIFFCLALVLIFL